MSWHVNRVPQGFWWDEMEWKKQNVVCRMRRVRALGPSHKSSRSYISIFLFFCLFALKHPNISLQMILSVSYITNLTRIRVNVPSDSWSFFIMFKLQNSSKKTTSDAISPYLKDLPNILQIWHTLKTLGLALAQFTMSAELGDEQSSWVYLWRHTVVTLSVY